MFWKKKAYDNERQPALTEADKREISDRFFMAAAILAALVIISTSLSLAFSYKREAKDAEKVLKTVYAYLATATKDEYDEVATEIRDDMVLRSYDDAQWDYIKLIPNTSGTCRLEGSFPCEAYVLSTNNGGLYALDIYQDGERPGTKSEGTSMSWGYDEISEASIQIVSEADKAEATIDRGRDILSVHRMKTLFCDECIQKILESNKNVLTPEFILYDPKAQSFYPLESGEEYQLGEYALNVDYTDWSTYKIEVSYIGT